MVQTLPNQPPFTDPHNQTHTHTNTHTQKNTQPNTQNHTHKQTNQPNKQPNTIQAQVVVARQLEGAARQETCKPQTGSEPDLESVSTATSWRSDGPSSRIDSRPMSRPKSSSGQRVLDDDRASMVEQITAGSKKLKQSFETHAENLKDLLAQSCRAGMARLTDLEVKAEDLDAELLSQQDTENKVNKLDPLISDSLQNAADGCDSFRARFEHLESRTLQEDTKIQSDGMWELEKKLEEQADELRADLKSHEQVTIGLVLNAPTVTAESEGDEEEVALTSATMKRMRGSFDSCRLAATAGQRLKARERRRVDESRLPVRAVEYRVASVYFARTLLRHV